MPTRRFSALRDAKLIVPGDPEYSVFNRDATTALFEHQMADAEAALRGKDYGKAQQAAAIARNTGVDSARVDDLTGRPAWTGDQGRATLRDSRLG